MNNILKKLKPFFIYLVLLGFFILLILSLLTKSFQNNTTSIIKSVFPEEGEILNTGKIQTFDIYFNNPQIQVNNYSFNISSLDTTSDNTLFTPIDIETLLLGKGQVELKTTQEIKEKYEYKLEILSKKNGEVVFSRTYLSTDILPTPVAVNNKSLVPYLPYETTNFSLEYLKDQNRYIFHFVYNADSDVPIDNQLEQAKTDAAAFINSKGIDINTLVIEWRNS